MFLLLLLLVWSIGEYRGSGARSTLPGDRGSLGLEGGGNVCGYSGGRGRGRRGCPRPLARRRGQGLRGYTITRAGGGVSTRSVGHKLFICFMLRTKLKIIKYI